MRYISIILAALLYSCANSTKNNNSAKDTVVIAHDTIAVNDSVLNDPNTTSDDYANYYLVVADTGADYYTMMLPCTNWQSYRAWISIHSTDITIQRRKR